MQGMGKCNPRGRDCIEENSALAFNCSINCEGIYADVEWFKDNKGFGRDKLKYKRLISEYNTFKRNIVQHFKFDPANDSTMFRKLQNFLSIEYDLP